MPKTHLTLQERAIIEDSLNRKESFYSIAKRLGRSTSTISREVKNRRTIEGKRIHDCLYYKDCAKHNACGKMDCRRLCKNCKGCQKYCGDYVQAFCERIANPPYVCNGCYHAKKYCQHNSCQYQGAFYRANDAQEIYDEILVGSRDGFDLTLGEINEIDRLVSPMVLNGCSIYHIVNTLGDKLSISESTVRRLINSQELTARNIDLRDKVKRRERKHRNSPVRISVNKIGHLYSDFLSYMEHNDCSIVEMDCVEGSKEDKCALLTLHFKELHFQIAIILEKHDSENVVKALDKIELSLGTDLFREIFPIILTDNGHEFTDISGMEKSIVGEKRTKIFFCEPNRSDEKGSCENNHKYLRYIIPKGTSIDHLMQDDINLVMNHINSFKRKSLYGKSPYEVASKILPEDFFIFLGLYPIAPEDVILTPKLLKSRQTK